MFMFEQKLKRIALNEFKEAYNWNGNFIIFENLKSVYMFYNSNDEVIYIGGLKKLNKIKYMKQLNEDWFIREVVRVRCFVFSPEENKELKEKLYGKLDRKVEEEISKETKAISTEEKIKIFMEIFKGRTDIYAKRWTSSTTGKSGYSPVCCFLKVVFY